MKKRQLNTPFFVMNPKSYLYGDELIKLAKSCDSLSEKYGIDFLFTAQHADLYRLRNETKNLIVTAQHMDGHMAGAGMGKILPESIKTAGAEATFLNHAEHPMTTGELTKAINRADELGILTIVCANSVKEAEMIAALEPDVVVCEPTELIGTGKSSDVSYMKATNSAIRRKNPNIFILQAAGISSAADIQKALESGADASGGTSGIVAADDPVCVVDEMLQVMYQWKASNK
ncbi:MAG: triose-phosphate isomerase [Streptococcaceae bacterium]|jgi:triosephosphate isomerase|nr:triose-phosphate isomerase [Streptococcaceae bacterium]